MCLLLAAKVNDSKDIDFKLILDVLSKHLEVPVKGKQITNITLFWYNEDAGLIEIRANEFKIFSALEFSLHIKQEQYIPHFERIFNYSEFSNIQEYLGERMYTVWLRHYE